MIFNYKDWTSYVNWAVIIYVIIQFIIYWNTLQRWKWGYWSIDLIPAILVLFLWFLLFHMVRLNRLGDRVKSLEDRKYEELFG